MVKIPCRRNSQVNLRFLTDGKDKRILFFLEKRTKKPFEFVFFFAGKKNHGSTSFPTSLWLSASEPLNPLKGTFEIFCRFGRSPL